MGLKKVFPVLFRYKKSSEEGIDAIFEDRSDAQKFTQVMNNTCGTYYEFSCDPDGADYFAKKQVDSDDHCKDCNYDNPSCNSCLGS